MEIVEEAAEQAVPQMKPRTTLEFLFNADQKKALREIRGSVEERRFQVALLHGVTGSGKTAVYLAAMQSVLAAGRGSILLVPEIGLTPGVAADLHNIFGEEIAILHSSLSDAERAEQWHRIRRGEARIAVGTRSAIFAPVRDLALIIVDEEHDNSYKQEETPRYHGRDVAVMRAKALNATVVLGSATPSLESYYNATHGKYALIELPDRVQERPLPEVELVDMREEFQQTGKESVLSRKLIEETTAAAGARRAGDDSAEPPGILGVGDVPLLRRYAAVPRLRGGDDLSQAAAAAAVPLLRLPAAGAEDAVRSAAASMCSSWARARKSWRTCCTRRFPQARIGRMDRDTVRGHDDFERMLSEFQAGEIDLLVGTQMIAKGHDVHGVTLVGVVGADTRAGTAGFPRRRADLSTADPGGGARRARRDAGQGGAADAFSRITTRCSSRPAMTTTALRKKSCASGDGCTIRPLMRWPTSWCAATSRRRRCATPGCWGGGLSRCGMRECG